MGCSVTALEPSIGMRSLLYAEAFSRDIDRVTVDDRRWEDVWHDDFLDHDLIVACNSRHLTTLGFDTALEKNFRASPTRPSRREGLFRWSRNSTSRRGSRSVAGISGSRTSRLSR